MSYDADVVIIGAGAAGIAAAIELQSTNLTVLVLEARDRIGGRAHTDRETFPSTSIDLGASWIHSYGPTNVLYIYHKSLNLDRNQHGSNGIHRSFDYDGQQFTRDTLIQARDVYVQLYEHLEQFGVNKDKDDQSIEQVIQAKYERLLKENGPVKRLVDFYLSGAEQYDGSNFVNLSAKYWGTGSTDGGDYWVTSGYGNLLEKIAQKHDLSIRLNTFVTKINSTDPDRIAITLGNDSSVIHCRRVIITIPLGCLKKNTILFEPPLPPWKIEAINEMGMGVMNKLIIQFPECFWGAHIGSFSYACNERRGRFRMVICFPPPENILLFLTTGLFAQELESFTDIEILEQLMTFLQKIFPSVVIPNPINYKFTRWSHDPLAYGSYSNFAVHSGPHTIEQLARATSEERIQWAGEHTNINNGSEHWSFGCVHSAFESGQRAGKAIRDELCSSQSSINSK